VRDALQVLEVGEVSQRGGQGGDALVGEVVVVQAARARGRGADPEGGQPAPGADHSERARDTVYGYVWRSPYAFTIYSLNSPLPVHHTVHAYIAYGVAHREGCVRTPISMTSQDTGKGVTEGAEDPKGSQPAPRVNRTERRPQRAKEGAWYRM
jgi:hypothetical protein